MIILSEYMNDPYGVELKEPFETVIKVIRPTESDEFFEPIVSVDFFELVEGVRPLHPQKNRMFTLPDIEGLTDAEILEKFFILVPELKK